MAYGKIEKLFVGKDAQVRGTELTVISKSGGKTLYQHPLQRLLPFEIITDNNELIDDKYNINDSRRVDEIHIRNNRRPAQNTKFGMFQ